MACEPQDNPHIRLLRFLVIRMSNLPLTTVTAYFSFFSLALSQRSKEFIILETECDFSSYTKPSTWANALGALLLYISLGLYSKAGSVNSSQYDNIPYEYGHQASV